MAKTKISEYDSTAANNTDIDGINIAEGMSPSNVNNALREQMAHLKDGLGAGTPVFLDQTNNRLGVGTITPDGNLDITGSGNTDVYINTGNNSGDNSRIFFGDTADIDVGYLSYDHGTNSMTFGVNAAERMRIDSSGNFLVGGTTYSQNSSEKMSVFGRTGIEADDGVVLGLDRQTSDGEHIQFRKDDSTVGAIGANSGSAYFVNASTGGIRCGSLSGSTLLLPTDENGASEDAVHDLGYSTVRWRNLYLSGGAYVGGTTSSHHFDDYEEGVFLPFSGIGSAFTGESVRTARYRKIGNMVAIDCRLAWTGTDGSGNATSIQLPFACHTGSVDATAYTGAVLYEGTQLHSGASIHTHVASGQSQFGFYKGGGGSFTQTARSAVNGTYDFIVSFVYFTAP